MIKAGEIARVRHEGYDVSLLNDGFQQLGSRLRLDYLVIDTHPGLNEETLLSIATRRSCSCCCGRTARTSRGPP